MSVSMEDLYCVVYRTGGTDNFKWHRSESSHHAGAVLMYHNCKKMGYKAHVVKYWQSLAIGLPDTYEYPE